MNLPPDNLEAALLAAHATGENPALVTLYAQAGKMRLAAAEVDAGCFYLTQAYIYALDCGHEKSAELHAILRNYGREE